MFAKNLIKTLEQTVKANAPAMKQFAAQTQKFVQDTALPQAQKAAGSAWVHMKKTVETHGPAVQNASKQFAEQLTKAISNKK